MKQNYHEYNGEICNNNSHVLKENNNNKNIIIAKILLHKEEITKILLKIKNGLFSCLTQPSTQYKIIPPTHQVSEL